MSVARYGGKIIIPENGSPIKVEPVKEKSKILLNSSQEEEEEEVEEEVPGEEEEEEEEEEFLCPICQGGEDETDSYAKLAECQHIFCEPCITEWSKNANTCPICRNRFDHLCTCPNLRGDFSVKVKIDYKCPNKEVEVVLDNYVCQICNSGQQEDLLLLCDGCDEAYHTHCLTPALETIPDGDWFCRQCSGGAEEEEEERGLDITPSGGSIRLPSTTRRLAMEELLRRTRRTSERRQSRGERRRASSISQAAQLISSITGRARTAKGAKLARIATRTVGLHTLRGLKRKKTRRYKKQKRALHVPDWSPPMQTSPERLQAWDERDKIEGDIAGFSKAALAAHKAHKSESILGAHRYLSEPGPSVTADSGPSTETPVNLIDMITADIINSSSKTPTVDKKGDVVYKTREEVLEEISNIPPVNQPEEAPRKSSKVKIKSPQRRSSQSELSRSNSKSENPHQAEDKPSSGASAREKKLSNESKSGRSRSYSSSPRRGKKNRESKEKPTIPSNENDEKAVSKVPDKSKNVKNRSLSSSSSERRKERKHKKHRRNSDHKKEEESTKKKKKSRRRTGSEAKKSSDNDSSAEEKDKTRRKHRHCSKSEEIVSKDSKAEEKRSKSKKCKKEKSEKRDDSEESERQKNSKKSSKDQKKKKKEHDKPVDESRSKKRRDSKKADKPRRKTPSRSRSNSLEIMENLRDKYSDKPASSVQNSPKSDRSSSRKRRQSPRTSPDRRRRDPRRREPEKLDDFGRDVNLRKVSKKSPEKSSNQDRSSGPKSDHPRIKESYTGTLGSLDDVYSPGNESPLDDVWPTKSKPDQTTEILVPSLDEIKLPEITDIVQKLAIPGFTNTMKTVGEAEIADSDDMVIDSEEDVEKKPTKNQPENKKTESSSSSSPQMSNVSDLFIKMKQAESLNTNKSPSPKTPEFLAPKAESPAAASPSASTPEYLMTPPHVQEERRRERLRRQSDLERKHSKPGAGRRKRSSEAGRRRSGGDDSSQSRRRSEDRRKSGDHKKDSVAHPTKRRPPDPAPAVAAPSAVIPLLDSSPPPPPPPPPRDTVIIRDHGEPDEAALVVSNGSGSATTTAPLVYVNNNNNNSHDPMVRKRARQDPPSPLSVSQIMGSPSVMFGVLNDSYAMEQFNDAWDKEAASPPNYQESPSPRSGRKRKTEDKSPSPAPPPQPVDPRSKDRSHGNPLQLIMDSIGKDMVDTIGSDDMDIEEDDVPPPPPAESPRRPRLDPEAPPPAAQAESTTPADPPPAAKKPPKKASKDPKPAKEPKTIDKEQVKQEIANIVKLALKVPYKKKKISKDEYKIIMKHVVCKVYESRQVKRGDPLRPDKITEMVAVYIRQSKQQKKKEQQDTGA